MSSNIFGTLLERKIETFINTFSTDSNSIFKDINNKLIHPGEYGMYKEEAFKELLRMILNKRQMISDGFIISADNSVSTQCDILVYNYDTIPLIDSNIARFFPIEEVNAIGEIKSILSKSELKKALLKLAENKKLSEKRTGSRTNLIKPFLEHNYLTSFLVCQKINCDISSIDWEQIYESLPRKYWHNAILSLEDGFLGYELQSTKLDLLLKQIYGIEQDASYVWERPSLSYNDKTYNCTVSLQKPDKDDRYRHIIEFVIALQKTINSTNTYSMDAIRYLGFND